MQEYRKEVKSFYEIFLPLQRRYDLWMYSHFSVWENGWIKIYQKDGQQKKLIVKTESESDAACYRMAREQLCSWEATQQKEGRDKKDEII